MSRRRRVRASAQGTGARARARHAAVLALALGRREAVQDGRTSARPKPRAIQSCGCALLLPADRLRRKTTSTAIAQDVDREITEAADARDRGTEADARYGGRSTSTRPDVDPTSPEFCDTARARRQAGHDGGRDQPDAEGRDGARPAHRRVRRGRRRLQPRRGARRRCRARAASSRSRTASSARSAATACSTRRSPRPTSSGAPSAWRRAASSRSSRSSSSTTSGRR